MNAFLSNLELVFGWLLAASWQASVLALAVVVIQSIFGARLNPRWRYALWLLVVLRLVLPVLPESALSLFQFAPPPPAALTVSVTQPLFVAAPVPPRVDVPMVIARPVHTLSLYSLLAIGWLTGALGLLLLTVIVNRRFARQVANSPDITDPELLRLFAEAKAEFHIRRPIRLIENSQVQSPAIMGLFHPALLLPVNVRENFDPRELRFIFLHELAHLKRGDVLIQALIALLQILHWFNPVLWFAFRRMRIDREPATDALVLSRTGESEKERYGLMLIKLLEHFNQRHSLATLVGILEEKDQFKRRFSLIARFTGSAYGWSLLGAFILVVLAIGGLTEAHRAAFKRDPALPLALDLKPFYNRVFVDPTGADSKYKGYAGNKTIDGLPFDVGGQIELYGQEEADRGKEYRNGVSGIKVDRKFDELHVVHAVDWREYYGCPVATIRLHYTDGTSADLTIRFNQQVNDWNRLYTEDAEVIDDPGTKIIWRGAGVAEGVGRLFKSVLNNPFPEKKVDTMDVVSTRSGCSYSLIAATVAQREPGRAVTPPMALLPPRNFAGQLKIHVVDKKTKTPIAGAEIYPAMLIGDISLVADNVLTGDDGTAVVKYPTGADGGAKDLRLKVVRAGYANCEIHWNNGWDAGEIPGEITYGLAREGDTSGGAGAEYTPTPTSPISVFVAVKTGDAAGLQKLIDQGVEIPKTGADGEPLLFAAKTAAVVEVLLAHGADANARNKQNDPAINFFCRNGGNDRPAIVEALLKHGADANARAGELGDTPLMDGYDGKTVDVLFAHGADPKLKRTDGVGVMDGVGSERIDYFEALLRHGVPFDPKTDGSTILLRASWVANIPIMKAMLDRGVDPNKEGLWAMVNGKPDRMKPLSAAVVDGQFDAVKLLLDHGAKADEAMDTALTNRQSKVVKLFWDHGVRNISELSYQVTQRAPVADLQKLLDAGMPADPPADAKSDFSPLTIAAQLGELDAVKLLVARGADVNKGAVPHPKFPVWVTSPLVMAASEGQVEVVQFLLGHGAKVSPSALWQAAENSTPYSDQRPKEDFEKCVRLLIDAGALKGATPEQQGYILSSGLGTRQGPANVAVLKMLLDAGISPEVPMPYIVENGEKPNSVIGYYRQQYQKFKDNPLRASFAAELKPLLDMLEAADKGVSKKVGSAETATGTLAQLVLALHDRAKSIPPGRERLQILQGFCGADGSWRDVTEVLQKSVQNNSLKISWQQPYTEIGGDPAYLQVKTLIVSYRLDGVEKLDTFREENPPVGLQAILTTPDPAGEKIDAKKPGDATVGGQLTIPVAAHPDFKKSTGVLVSDEGVQYPIAFDEAGKFIVTGVAPGRYRAVVHMVCEPRDHVVGADKTFGFTQVGPGTHVTLNVAWDPTPPAKDGIEIGLKIVQIDEDVYQANKKKIDAGVEKGGVEIIGLLNQMKGVSLLSAPSVTTKPGQKANVDIVSEMPYPTGFENPKLTSFVAGSASSPTNMAAYIPPTPMEFKTKDIGVSAEITPALIGKTLSPQGAVIPDRIMLSGKFSVAEFEGFTQSNIAPISTPTFNTSESHFVEALADGELKGVWIPGSHYRTADALNQLPGVKTDPNAPTIKTRYLLFLSARKVD